MKRKILTLAAAIVAIGGAFAGSSNAKSLLVDQGWYRNADGTDRQATSTASAVVMCEDNSNETCLYKFDQNATEPSDVIRGQFRAS